MVENLMEGLLKEIKRNRELVTEYRAIGQNGGIAILFIEGDIEDAEQAIKDNDVVAMARAYKKLKGHE